ncbi:MAG: hypothetical protein QF464_18440, partial [Myxococcota bacterium]|nr:hypothetical protein [Myxococcota bacterium]
QIPRALALAEALVKKRTGLAVTRSAWARAALAAGDLELATLQAGVPVESGGAVGDSVVTLAAVLAAGGAEHAPIPRWKNMLERNPTTTRRGLGAALHFVLNEYDDALAQVLAVEVAMPDAAELKAMRAVLLARSNKLDEARAALTAAWESRTLGLWAVAAEAELAEAEARTADAIGVWEAYIAARPPALGPLTVAQAQERLRALGRAAPRGTPSRETSPQEPSASKKAAPTMTEKKDRIPTWVWLVLIMVAVVGLYGWRRSRG